MNDIQTTWPICVAVLFIAFGISIIVMLLIRLCGGCIVIGLIVIKLAALITFGGVSFAASRN